MAFYTRETLPELLAEATDKSAAAYLFVGDRFLCQQASAQLEKKFLANGGMVHALDGESEDPARTISRLRSFSLLPGHQLYRISDTRLFYSKKVAKSLWSRIVAAKNENKPDTAARHLRSMMTACGLDPSKPEDDPAELGSHAWKKHFDFPHPGGDLSWLTVLLTRGLKESSTAPKTSGQDPAALLQETLEAGIPTKNILLLLAEEVDKRKRFYKYLKDRQVVVDLSVDKGAGSKAQKAQKTVLMDLINTTLKRMGKTMAPGVVEQLLDRVGFYPVAVVMETEKLCLSLGSRKQIKQEDLDDLVGRTRQEALFELTGAIGRQQLAASLAVIVRLLDNQVHPLAVIATLRNYARKLLLFKVLQQQHIYGYTPGMPANLFQRQCLPALKKNSRWKQELSGHPYALYMQFNTASNFPSTRLQQWLQLILQAEGRLKGSPFAPLTVLQHLVLSMLLVDGHNVGNAGETASG